MLDQRQEARGAWMLSYLIERDFKFIFVGQEIVRSPQIKREFKGSHKVEALGDVFESALIEEISVAGRASRLLSSVSVNDHLGVSTARHARVTD
jgi:hypothetical protein